MTEPSASAPSVLVIVESATGGLARAALEALFAARAVHDALGGRLEAVVLGPEARGAAGTVAAAGCEHVHVCEASELTTSWAAVAAPAVAELAQSRGAGAIVLPGTESGQELAGRLAVRLASACATQCVAVRSEDGTLVADRRIHGSRFVQTVRWERGVRVLTVAPGAFPPFVAPPVDASVSELAVEAAPNAARRVATGRKTSARPDIVEASTIVSVGRGIGGPERIAPFEELADVLGAGLGASRAVVDAGWLDHAHQIGQTGRSVAPRVYVACAISGAVQHLIGMSGARFVLAINTDPEAPIFKAADVGVVADVFELVPRLAAALRAQRTR